MNIEIIRRLCLAKHLNELSINSLRSSNEMHLFASVNLLHDAAEAFLIAVGEYVSANIDTNTKFDKYFVEIDQKLAPSKLPFKSALLRLNRIRVDSKHYGIQPTRDECERLAISVREFFDEVSTTVLGLPFTTISAINLLTDGEIKELLIVAKNALEKKDFAECAIHCRKAIYLNIEIKYDISNFIEDGKTLGLLGLFSQAPDYAKSKQYIDSRVKQPTDFIVYDHSSIDEILLVKGIDNTIFWNVWRLTPEVFRTKDLQWIVKYDFSKLDSDLLSDKIEYIFSSTLDIALSFDRAARDTKWLQNENRYFLELNAESVPIYLKADNQSQILKHTPNSITTLITDFRVHGLNDSNVYWHINDYHNDERYSGYIEGQYVKD